MDKIEKLQDNNSNKIVNIVEAKAKKHKFSKSIFKKLKPYLSN